MKLFHTTILLSILILSSSCDRMVKESGRDYKAQNADKKDNVDQEEDDFKVVLGAPIELDSSKYLLFPLGGQKSSRWGRKFFSASASADHYSAVAYDYGNNHSGNIENLIFFHRPSGKYHPLLTDDGFIRHFTFYPSRYTGLKENYLIYQIAMKDYNEDNLIDADDPAALFISSDDGKDLKQLTPTVKNVLSVSHIRSDNTLIIRMQSDTDEDGEFDADDLIEVYKADLKNPEKARPVFSEKELSSLN